MGACSYITAWLTFTINHRFVKHILMPLLSGMEKYSFLFLGGLTPSTPAFCVETKGPERTMVERQWSRKRYKERNGQLLWQFNKNESWELLSPAAMLLEALQHQLFSSLVWAGITWMDGAFRLADHQPPSPGIPIQ